MQQGPECYLGCISGLIVYEIAMTTAEGRSALDWVGDCGKKIEVKCKVQLSHNKNAQLSRFEMKKFNPPDLATNANQHLSHDRYNLTWLDFILKICKVLCSSPRRQL